MPPRAQPPTILLVDDEEVLRAVSARILSRQGYQVLEAGGGGTALELCRTHPGPIELLLTDLLMPGMTGRDLAAQILLLRPAVKVLFVSGYSQSAVLEGGLLAPGEALLAKPFTPDELAAKVREVLGR